MKRHHRLLAVHLITLITRTKISLIHPRRNRYQSPTNSPPTTGPATPHTPDPTAPPHPATPHPPQTAHRKTDRQRLQPQTTQRNPPPRCSRRGNPRNQTPSNRPSTAGTRSIVPGILSQERGQLSRPTGPHPPPSPSRPGPSSSAAAPPPSTGAPPAPPPAHLRQRPLALQLLQHHNPIGSSVSHPGPLRGPFLLFLPLLRNPGRSSASSAVCSSVSGPRPANASNTATRSAAAFPPGIGPRSFSFFSATAAPSAEAPPAPPPAPPSAAPDPPTPPTPQPDRQQPFPSGTDPRPFPSFRCCAFGRSSASSAVCSSVSGPGPPSPPTPQHGRQHPFSPGTAPRPLPSFLPLLRLWPKRRQLGFLLVSQLPLALQRLQLRNTGGSNLSRPGILRIPILLFLPLLHFRPELRQLRLLRLGQRPPLRQRLQLRNPIGSSLSRPGPTHGPFLLFPFPLRTRVLLRCLSRRRKHPTPAIPGPPETNPAAADTSTFRRLTAPEPSPTSPHKLPAPAPTPPPPAQREPDASDPSPPRAAQPPTQAPQPGTTGSNTTPRSDATSRTGITHTPVAAKTSAFSATSPSADPADPPPHAHHALRHAPQ